MGLTLIIEDILRIQVVTPDPNVRFNSDGHNSDDGYEYKWSIEPMLNTFECGRIFFAGLLQPINLFSIVLAACYVLFNTSSGPCFRTQALYTRPNFVLP